MGSYRHLIIILSLLIGWISLGLSACRGPQEIQTAAPRPASTLSGPPEANEGAALLRVTLTGTPLPADQETSIHFVVKAVLLYTAEIGWKSYPAAYNRFEVTDQPLQKMVASTWIAPLPYDSIGVQLSEWRILSGQSDAYRMPPKKKTIAMPFTPSADQLTTLRLILHPEVLGHTNIKEGLPFLTAEVE